MGAGGPRSSSQGRGGGHETDLIEVRDGDHFSVCDGDCAGQYVIELDLVAWPSVLDQSSQRARIEAHGLPTHANAQPGQAIDHQCAQVFSACSEWGKRNRAIAEPIGEQRIETSVGDQHVHRRGDRHDERNIEGCGMTGG